VQFAKADERGYISHLRLDLKKRNVHNDDLVSYRWGRGADWWLRTEEEERDTNVSPRKRKQ
jgi:hypothetical protein